MLRVYSGSVEPAPLEGPLAQAVARRLVELVGRRPADVGATNALAAVEPVVRERVQHANAAAAEALDPEGGHLTVEIGRRPRPMTLERGLVGSSVACEASESLLACLVGRVLRLDLLAANPCNRVVRGDRGLAHADRDQRDLALVAGDVARGVDARERRLAGRRVDQELALPVQLETPVGDRAQMRVEA